MLEQLRQVSENNVGGEAEFAASSYFREQQQSMKQRQSSLAIVVNIAKKIGFQEHCVDEVFNEGYPNRNFCQPQLFSIFF